MLFRKNRKIEEQVISLDNRVDALEELTMRMLRDNQTQINILMDTTKSLEERIANLEKMRA